MRGAFTIALLLLVGGASPSLGQDSPLDFIKRLIAPPAAAVTETFAPRASPTAAPQVPMPVLRPGTVHTDPGSPPVMTTAPALAYAPGTDATETGSVPRPNLRPSAAFAALTALPTAATPKLTRPPPAAQSTCGMALAMMGVEVTPLAPVAESGNCRIAAPVAVAALDDGAVAFTTKAIVECRLAETLAEWTRDAVQPNAEAILGKRVTGLRVAASYACRNRNGLDDAKLSEHAKGNAIDVSAFRLGDHWIKVEDGWLAGGPETAFLRAVRQSACGPFKTVLGPGSDAYHSDHFHLDIAKRRGGGTYCR